MNDPIRDIVIVGDLRVEHQYDLGLEYRGHAQEGDELLIRGSLAAREFIAFWHRNGHVHAAMNVNVWDAGDDLQALLASPDPVDQRALTDPSTPLTPAALLA